MRTSSKNFGIVCLLIAFLCLLSIFLISKVYFVVPITLGIIFSIYGYLFGLKYKSIK